MWVHIHNIIALRKTTLRLSNQKVFDGKVLGIPAKLSQRKSFQL